MDFSKQIELEHIGFTIGVFAGIPLIHIHRQAVERRKTKFYRDSNINYLDVICANSVQLDDSEIYLRGTSIGFQSEFFIHNHSDVECPRAYVGKVIRSIIKWNNMPTVPIIPPRRTFSGMVNKEDKDLA